MNNTIHKPDLTNTPLNNRRMQATIHLKRTSNVLPGETIMLDQKTSLDTFKRIEIIQISYQIGISNRNMEITLTLPDFKAYNGATVIKTVLVLARGQIHTLTKQTLKSR